MLLADRETNSYWDHITGECVHGALKGRRLEVFPLVQTVAGTVVEAYPDARVPLPMSWHRRLHTLAFRGLSMLRIEKSARTRRLSDGRRPFLETGLGVWSVGIQRYYPMKELRARG